MFQFSLLKLSLAYCHLEARANPQEGIRLLSTVACPADKSLKLKKSEGVSGSDGNNNWKQTKRSWARNMLCRSQINARWQTKVNSCRI